MRIGNNFSTYNSKPQFGMALKIKSADGLKNMGRSTLNNLEKLGEELKDYKFWDLNIVKDGITITSKTDNTIYHSPYKLKSYDTYYNALNVYSRKTGFFKEQPEVLVCTEKQDFEKALEVFEMNFPSYGTELSKAHIIIKSLENFSQIKADEIAKENKMMSGLIQKYGAEN